MRSAIEAVSAGESLEVIVGEFFRAGAGQRIGEAGLDDFGRGAGGAAAEVVARIEHRRGLAVAREGDVGGVPVEVWGGENVGAVDGGALRFVDGGGVAVIQMLVELGIDGNAGARVQLDLEDTVFDAFDGAKRAVLDAQSLSLRPKRMRSWTANGFCASRGRNLFAAAELAGLAGVAHGWRC